MQIYGNSWICVCISSSHPHSLGVQPPGSLRPFRARGVNQPHITSNQQITRNSRPHPTMLMLARDTAAAHYHPLPIIHALPYCRSFSFSAQHTHTRKGAVETEGRWEEQRRVCVSKQPPLANQLTCSHLIIMLSQNMCAALHSVRGNKVSHSKRRARQ